MQLAAKPLAPMLPPAVLAADSLTGPVASIGSGKNCYKNPFPVAAPVILTSRPPRARAPRARRSTASKPPSTAAQFERCMRNGAIGPRMPTVRKYRAFSTIATTRARCASSRAPRSALCSRQASRGPRGRHRGHAQAVGRSASTTRATLAFRLAKRGFVIWSGGAVGDRCRGSPGRARRRMADGRGRRHGFRPLLSARARIALRGDRPRRGGALVSLSRPRNRRRPSPSCGATPCWRRSRRPRRGAGSDEKRRPLGSDLAPES